MAKLFAPSALTMALCLGALTAPAFATTTDNSSPANSDISSQFGDQDVTDDQIIIPPNENADARAAAYDNLDPQRDLAILPSTVAKTRDQLMDAARSGDVERFRPIIDAQPEVPQLSFGVVDQPIQYLRDSSNDGEGLELMAIMLELLEAPYAVQDFGDGRPKMFVWPAYATHNLQELNPQELVEVYKIVSHLDVEEMRLYGGWYFFRVGIDENGVWRFFVAGD
ncbi:hypothetical protein MXMO3_02694 [Maritalea myrionectae]|uniref:Uncharacterized protein n=1 Tax=Maritalea myrionectae TaxID=454601 RepID=A0A2R4MGW2_9HYPH|nr:hypothetical protein [Maritalea myrionectae]AVX05205.1 hypothetical protein MXMO3_02694 [Maritalea myrionectae]